MEEKMMWVGSIHKTEIFLLSVFICGSILFNE